MPEDFDDDTQNEIKSFTPEKITSAGLFGLKESIINAGKEKSRLKGQFNSDKSARSNAKILLFLSRLIVIGFFVAWFKNNYQEKNAIFASSEEVYKNFSLEVDFNFDDKIKSSYMAFKNSFDKVCDSEKIWDITSAQFNDKVKTRSVAEEAINRKAVKFTTGTLDFIHTKYEAFKLNNVNGGDIYIYPGFVVMLGSHNDDFGLVDLRDIKLEHCNQQFIEEENVPYDAEVIDKTWKYANKNGSRDKRYSDNCEIPIVLYYKITIRSSSGVNECYQFSNAKFGRNFSSEFEKYLNVLSSLKWSGKEDVSGIPRI